MTKEIIKYQTKGTCSKEITVVVEDDVIKQVGFLGGCNGNLKGISSLLVDMKINDAIKRLKGITCGDKNTSCPDQVALCLEQYITQKSKAIVG